MPVISICLSPGFQRSVLIDALTLGEVNRLDSVIVDVSGKGVNVCRVLQWLGVDALCLAQGGSNGDALMALAEREGLNLRLIPASGQLRTCTSIIETALPSGCRVTELVEPNSEVDAACVERLSARVQALLPKAAALVIAGSMAPGFPPGYQARLAAMAGDCGVSVFLDIQGAALREAVAMHPALVKINLAEFVAAFLAGRFQGGEHSGVLAQAMMAPELTHAIAEVSRQHATSFVLTRGANSILLAGDGEVRVVPVPPLAARETLNPVGSGDAFLAGMLTHLLAAGSLRPGNKIDLNALEKATGLATACAQSNARTTRPGFLEASFTPAQTFIAGAN